MRKSRKKPIRKTNPKASKLRRANHEVVHKKINLNEQLYKEITNHKRIQKAPQESEDKGGKTLKIFELLFDAIPDVIGIQDRHHGIIQYNAAGYKFLNMTHKEVEGKKCYELIGRNTPCDICATTECYKTKKPTRVEKYVEELDIWLDARAYPILDENGEIVKVIEHLRDITKRKQAEEALRQANLVVENSPVVLFRWKAAEGWPVELVSENVIQFGYTPEELLSGEVSYASLVHPGDLKRVAHEVQEHSASGVNSFRQEYRIITKDGKVCWVDDRTVIERDSDGQITHYQGIVIDITKRKLAEKELQEYRDRLEEIIKERTAELTAANEQLKQEITERRWIEKALLESEKQYRELFENAIIGIYKSTPDGKIVAANPTLVKMLGYSSFEELTKHNLEKEKFMSYERSSFKEILKQDGEIIGLESKWIRKDGSARHVVENAKAIRDKNGEIIYYEGTVEDITKHKKLEANIQELREELVHVSRVTTMGELVASLAHEINQPLTAILSNAQVAQRFLDGNAPNLDELSEILSDIVKDNKRAVEVITKLRALLKKDVVNFRPLDINEAVEEIIFFVQSDMERKNVAIATELVADIPLILGDRVQLQQVILNLIMNGAEAMADTEPALRKLIIRTEKQDEQNVKVAVQDLGTGFNVDTIEHMFDSFYTTKSKGMGMGLWISRSIIEVHKGLLQAENNSDKGATFWFVIPVGKLEVN